LLDLLELESQAEARQVVERVARLSPAEAEASGYALCGLVMRDGHGGLGGRYIVTLGRRNPNERLPWTRLGPGTPVVPSPLGQRRAEGLRGVMVDREDFRVRVALNEPPEEEAEQWRVDVAPDQAARERQRQALERARSAKRDRFAELRAVLLGQEKPRFD